MTTAACADSSTVTPRRTNPDAGPAYRDGGRADGTLDGGHAADGAVDPSDASTGSDAGQPWNGIVRNGFLQSDGLKSWSQDCDLRDDGTLDCDASTHPFTEYATPETVLAALDDGQHVGSRYAFAYVAAGVRRVRNGFMQSDGRKSWSQDCDVRDDGHIDCTAALSPFTMATTPDHVLAFLDAGQHVAGRYLFTYIAGGEQRLRNGYVQSDGLKTWSQTCDMHPDGGIDCEAALHPFTVYATSPDLIARLDPGQSFGCRYTFSYRPPTGQRLRSGFMQADGRKAWSQDCDIASDGALDCDVATHPFGAYALPAPAIAGLIDPDQHLSWRYLIAR